MKNLYQKLLAVHKAVDTIPKRGRNDFHKYSYATEADILSIKEKINGNGLVVLPTMAGQETGFTPGGKNWAKVTITFRVVDVETGECLESQFTGYAEDSFDKAIYKATTGANKYFYLKFFGMATGDDPENESQVPAQNSVRKNTNPPARKIIDKDRALKAANEVLAIQREYNLTKDEVLRIGGIDSIKQLAEVGNYTALEQAARRIKQHKNRAAV